MAAKFVQIAISGHANTNATQCDWTALALDEFGQVWWRANNESAWTPWQEYTPKGGDQ